MGRSVEDLRDDDIGILLLGPTGTGKSNIIDLLSQHPVKRADSGLNSFTATVNPVRLKNYKSYGDRVIMIDTPGFNDTDTNKSDAQILELIREWLRESSQKAPKILRAICFLHRISDPRMDGGNLRALEMFQKLVHESQTAASVIYITTMWDILDGDIPEQRETHLKKKYWKLTLDSGASTKRFHNTQDSAMDILDHVLGVIHNKNEPITFSIYNTMMAYSSDPGYQPRDEHEKVYHAQSSKSTKVLFLILGQTGVGKSTFVNYAAGEDVATVNHTSKAHNLAINCFDVQHPNRSRTQCLFLDTPGFNQPHDGDDVILKTIANWFKHNTASYPNMTFGGIIFLHSIDEKRNQSNIESRILSNIFVPEPMKHLILTTVATCQNNKEDDRREELRKKNWKHLLSRNASAFDFTNTKESAWDIVDRLLEHGTLDISVIQENLDKICNGHKSRKTQQPDNDLVQGFFSMLMKFSFIKFLRQLFD